MPRYVQRATATTAEGRDTEVALGVLAETSSPNKKASRDRTVYTQGQTGFQVSIKIRGYLVSPATVFLKNLTSCFCFLLLKQIKADPKEVTAVMRYSSQSRAESSREIS